MKEIFYATMTFIITRSIIYASDIYSNVIINDYYYISANYIIAVFATLIYLGYIIQIIYKSIRKKKSCEKHGDLS